MNNKTSIYIPYMDKDYKTQRNYRREFAKNSEIEFILDTLADEIIIYNKDNYFAGIDTSLLENLLPLELNTELINSINTIYQNLYSYFHFNDDIIAWQYFKQLITDKYLAFEIIYSASGNNIIGFKELDPITLRPDREGMKKVWWQYEDSPQMKRKLYDSQVIYISSEGSLSLSYLERLMRSFNLLRTIENSIVMNSINNAVSERTISFPAGSNSPQKVEKQIEKYEKLYNNNMFLDSKTGELIINNETTKFTLDKNYIISHKKDQEFIIKEFEKPYNLFNRDCLEYFKQNLYRNSRLPRNRFDTDLPTNDREEKTFNKFKDKQRILFQEILLKPLKIQIKNKFPHIFDNNLNLLNNIKLKFYDED